MKRGNILFMEKGNGASLQEFIESQREGGGGRPERSCLRFTVGSYFPKQHFIDVWHFDCFPTSQDEAFYIRSKQNLVSHCSHYLDSNSTVYLTMGIFPDNKISPVTCMFGDTFGSVMDTLSRKLLTGLYITVMCPMINVLARTSHSHQWFTNATKIS